MDDPSKPPTCCWRCAHSGVSLSVDDFGTRDTVIAHLKRFQSPRSKIDREFVRDM